MKAYIISQEQKISRARAGLLYFDLKKAKEIRDTLNNFGYKSSKTDKEWEVFEVKTELKKVQRRKRL